MGRYIRMVMLLLAGLCFMIPMLGKTSSARPAPHGHFGHGPTGNHQTFVAEGPDVGNDDPSAPCAP